MEKNAATKLMVEKLLSEKVDFVPAKFPDSSDSDRPSSYIIINNTSDETKRSPAIEDMNFASAQKSLKLAQSRKKNGENQPTQSRPKSLQEALNSYSGNQKSKKQSKKQRQKENVN